MRIYQEQTTGARRSGVGCLGCLSPLLMLGFGCGITGLVFGGISASRQGSDAAAIAAFSQCPAVVAALGTPLQKRPLSMGCGEFEGGPTSGEGSWQITIQGPRGSASGSYSASYRDSGPWTVHSGTLRLPGGTVSLPCAPEPAPRPAPSPSPAPRRGGKRRNR